MKYSEKKNKIAVPLCVSVVFLSVSTNFTEILTPLLKKHVRFRSRLGYFKIQKYFTVGKEIVVSEEWQNKWKISNTLEQLFSSIKMILKNWPGNNSNSLRYHDFKFSRKFYIFYSFSSFS